MTSAVLIIPDAYRAQAEAFGVANGWGDGNYSVGLSASGTAPATHWGCRADVGAGFVAMVATPAPEHAALASVLMAHFSDVLSPYDHWVQAIAVKGLRIVE